MPELIIPDSDECEVFPGEACPHLAHTAGTNEWKCTAPAGVKCRIRDGILGIVDEKAVA